MALAADAVRARPLLKSQPLTALGRAADRSVPLTVGRQVGRSLARSFDMQPSVTYSAGHARIRSISLSVVPSRRLPFGRSVGLVRAAIITYRALIMDLPGMRGSTNGLTGQGARAAASPQTDQPPVRSVSRSRPIPR